CAGPDGHRTACVRGQRPGWPFLRAGTRVARRLEWTGRMTSGLDEIAERHRVRADLYAAIGRLLRQPPGPDELLVLRAVLARHAMGNEAAGARSLDLLRLLAAAPDLASARREYRA